MNPRRFFIDPEAVIQNSATLTGAEAHHIRRVLRLTPGTLISLFDGTGNIYQARIESIDRESVKTSIIESGSIADDRPGLHLCMALLKGKKMEFIIQKATELGISSIHPFLSRHSAVKPPGENRENRWQRIAFEACKQCNRPVPPDCLPLVEFSSILKISEPFHHKLILWEQEKELGFDRIISPHSLPESLFFVVGPEGGFSDPEIKQALSAGFSPVTLGRRTLRAETAALAAMVILQFLLGNLGSPFTHCGPRTENRS